MYLASSDSSNANRICMYIFALGAAKGWGMFMVPSDFLGRLQHRYIDGGSPLCTTRITVWQPASRLQPTYGMDRGNGNRTELRYSGAATRRSILMFVLGSACHTVRNLAGTGSFCFDSSSVDGLN